MIISPIGDNPRVIPGNTGQPLVPPDKPLSPVPTATKLSIDDIPNTFTRLVALELLVRVRELTGLAHEINKLLTLRVCNQPSDLNKALANIGSDVRFTKEVRALGKKVEEERIDFTDVLLNGIVLTPDFNEKTAYADAIFSYSEEAKKTFVSAYLVPALEIRNGFGESDRQFCVQLLESVVDAEKENLLWQINYNEITNLDIFASSLAALTNQDLVLSSLINRYAEFVNNTDKTEEEVIEEKKIAVIITALLVKLKQANEPIPIAKVTELYKLAKDRQFLDVLATALGENLADVYKDQFLDSSETDEEARYKRFSAIINYAKALGKGAVPELIKFVEDCKDPYLAGASICNLILTCGEEGKKAVSEFIYKRIINGEESMPLALVSSLTWYRGEFIDVVHSLLSKKYPDDYNLREAYKSASDIEFCRSSRHYSGDLIFYPDTEANPKLVVDMIKDIGLADFSDMVSLGDAETQDGNGEIIASNLKAIFNYAQEVDREAIGTLILGALAPLKKNEKAHSLALLLGDIKTYGLSSW